MYVILFVCHHGLSQCGYLYIFVVDRVDVCVFCMSVSVMAVRVRFSFCESVRSILCNFFLALHDTTRAVSSVGAKQGVAVTIGLRHMWP